MDVTEEDIEDDPLKVGLPDVADMDGDGGALCMEALVFRDIVGMVKE